MAVVLVLAGSVLGFFGAVFAYLALGASLTSALAIWALSGPLALALLARPRLPRPAEPAHLPVEGRPAEAA